MSLTTCIKKAGAALHADDKAAILSAAAEFRAQGMKPDAAARAAIAQQSEAVRALSGKAEATLKAGQEAAPEKPKVAPAAQAAGKEAPSLDTQRVTQLAADSPGLRVKLPGSDETLTVGEALTRAKEEAAAEASEADLVRAAVNCALGL